mmetsp:Transcript_16773/g.52247  ORF Transcript_16773/g.52247 Transcript_16773/m.52247 type:complete len:214 (-) Transcript_16773:1539-2180(-)
MFQREASQRSLVQQTGFGCDPLVSTVDQQWITPALQNLNMFHTLHGICCSRLILALCFLLQPKGCTRQEDGRHMRQQKENIDILETTLASCRGVWPCIRKPATIDLALTSCGLDPWSIPPRKIPSSFHHASAASACVQDIPQLPGVVKADFLSSGPFGRGDGVEPRVANNEGQKATSSRQSVWPTTPIDPFSGKTSREPVRPRRFAGGWVVGC